ncbi:MAG: DEAD/DEAH box helicase family protein, partial [Myxococcota bacterium]
MTVRFQFDAEQPHQREAVDAVVDALASLGSRRPVGEASRAGVVSHGEPLDLGRFLLDVQAVQARHGQALSGEGEGAELTVEMETGTGKTYAYLRAMRELYARYGLSRFIVVVPSVAIRCGVLAQIEALAEHFQGLYPEQRAEATLFDAQSLGGVRRFARDSGLQILVMNIDAFNKGRGNLGHRPADALGGETPVGLCAATRPVVILDEPQSMEGPRARAALAELRALVTLRWSATHRRAPHCVYRLDPVRAFAMGLVKRVEVAAVTAEGARDAAVTLLQTRATKRGVSAKLSVEGPGGPVVMTVRGEGEDLFEASGGVEACRGLVVRAVDHGLGAVDFESGLRLLAGAGGPDGAAREAIWRAQLEETVACHLERELACRRLLPAGQQMKVLSLVFLDRVDDYAADDGVVRREFCEAWERARADERFAGLELPPADRVHAGYFARRRGAAVDSTGKSREDDEAYALIMADKSRLLSPGEPVRFVFSHSALREGWDNPNVFQICTLRRTRSE